MTNDRPLLAVGRLVPRWIWSMAVMITLADPSIAFATGLAGLPS